MKHIWWVPVVLAAVMALYRTVDTKIDAIDARVDSLQTVVHWLETEMAEGRYELQTAKATITAYSPDSISCYPFNDGKTSTGRCASTRGVAADPKRLPYGSVVEIEGEVYKVDDTGSAMKDWGGEGYRLDLRFATHEEAVNFGIKQIEVRVWKKL